MKKTFALILISVIISSCESHDDKEIKKMVMESIGNYHIIEEEEELNTGGCYFKNENLFIKYLQLDEQGLITMSKKGNKSYNVSITEKGEQYVKEIRSINEIYGLRGGRGASLLNTYNMTERPVYSTYIGGRVSIFHKCYSKPYLFSLSNFAPDSFVDPSPLRYT